MKGKRTRRPLGRGWKIGRNCLLALALIFFVWLEVGCPLPTAELRFRRAERENLVLEPGEILGSLEWRDGLWMVGTAQEQVLLYHDVYEVMYPYVRLEGGTLMFLSPREWRFEAPLVLAADVPKEAVRASLTMEVQACAYVDFGEDGSSGLQYGRTAFQPEPEGYTRLDIDETYRAEGERLADGLFSFRLEKRYPGTDNVNGLVESRLLDAISAEEEQGVWPGADANWRVTATFYNEEGDEVGTLERSDWEA